MSEARRTQRKGRITLAGVSLRNRVIVAAGCHGASGDMIVRTAQYGVAAITTKTIVAQAAPDVRPCFAAVEGGFINSVFGTTLPAEQWFEHELPRAREAGLPVIASLAGLNPAEAADLACRAVAAGATMIEMPTVCPHMGEILEAMFPPRQPRQEHGAEYRKHGVGYRGLTLPPPETRDVSPYVANLQAVKEAVSVPVIAKFSALFHANVVEWALAAEKAGADAIACADAFGPAIKIDIESGEPSLGGPRGVGGLTGPALKPIALRMILEMAQHVSIPLIGVGGISRAEDAIEYFMAGASFVGMVTVGHLRGATQFRKIIEGIDHWIEVHGYTDVQDIIGLAVRKIAARRKRKLVAITQPQTPIINVEVCTGCRRCETSCVYDAIHVGADKLAHADPALCYGCGLCRDVCPARAIRFAYFD
jgi:dihydroorotate dehydrogenase (NAD+) catalytic subunit